MHLLQLNKNMDTFQDLSKFFVIFQNSNFKK